MALSPFRDKADYKTLNSVCSSRITDLARYLGLGEPTARNRREWRFGSRGSLSIVVEGSKAGSFTNFESGNNGGPLDLIMDVQGCDLRGAADIARSFCGMPAFAPHVTQQPAKAPEDPEAQRRAERAEERERIKIAARIWRESSDPRGTVVERYLASRGLTLPDEIAGTVLRYHPALKLGDRCTPAMVALLRDTIKNYPCGIIRTFLDEHGRKIKRLMKGRAKGAAVKLSPDEGGLHIAEGVETGIAAMLAGYRPVWALGSAGSIAKFPVLAGIEALTILTERGDGGANEKAVAEVAARWQAAGHEIFAVEMVSGDDFNDAWREATA